MSDPKNIFTFIRAIRERIVHKQIRSIIKFKFLLKKILNPGFDSMAWEIIYRVHLMGIGMAAIYLGYDFFFNENMPNHPLVGLALFPCYLLLLFLIIKYPGNKILRSIVVISTFLSMIVSFIFLTGNHYISTPTIIDFCVSTLVVTVVYRRWKRMAWLLVHAAVLVFFITLSILSYTNPEPDMYIMQSTIDFRFAHVEIFARLIFIFILGFTLIKDYDRQRQLVFHKNEEVSHLNKNLGALVKLRTEKLKDLNRKVREYSFLNSHKVRAPLARMMGLMNLINVEKPDISNNTLAQYLELLQASAEELDQVIREMNAHLSEQEEQEA